MNQDTITSTLTIYITNIDDTLFEGVVKELDIIVSGTSSDNVCEELEHVLKVYYYAEIHNNASPFSDLIRNPSQIFPPMNARAGDYHFGLDIRSEIEDALRSALQTHNMMFVEVYLIGAKS